MNWAVRRAVIVGGCVTIAAGLGVMLSTGIRATIVHIYLVAVGGIVLLALFRTARALEPQFVDSAFERALAAMRAPPPRAGELGLVRDLELSRLNAFHFYLRLRPVLQEIAANRLYKRYGVELGREPERARELIPSRTWEAVDPNLPPPADRLARGPSIASLRDIAEELERL